MEMMIKNPNKRNLSCIYIFLCLVRQTIKSTNDPMS